MEKKKRILLVSYDKSLLRTRRGILENAGYEVFSTPDDVEAVKICEASRDFDLLLMGNSMPQKNKSALVAALRPRCKAPLLTIRKHGDLPLPEANCSIEAPSDPSVLVDAVDQTLFLSALGRIQEPGERIRALEERIRKLQLRMPVAEGDELLALAKLLTETLDELDRAKSEGRG